nr:olfactory receptor 52A1-like [Pelodiscus sinensis]|eukprot:XP_025038656.1 olfactory receptor 52A1-like [Pelodiscus sinensis]
MSVSNTTHFTNPSVFILMGIPGLEGAYVWISIPFCAIYVITLLGNVAIMFIVKLDRSLHGPMYYFLCMLAITDIMLSTSILPKMLAIFWFDSREINFHACLIQIFFFKCSSAIESGIFVAMHASLLNLACADTRFSNYYGLFVQIGVMGLDVIFIAVSYIQILRAVFSLPTKEARHKTFGTCISHLCAMSAFYIPDVFSSLMSRFGQIVPLHVHILVSNVCLLVPLMLNPVIYGATIKQIWDPQDAYCQEADAEG